MKMVCIDNQDVEEILTIGNVYECSNKDGQLVDVLDNSGVINTYVNERFEQETDNCDDCGAEVSLKHGEDFFVEIPHKGSKMVCEKCYLEKYQQYYK